MAKRININGSRIFIERYVNVGKFGGYWTTKFDTDLKYLKTDPTGSLKAGGYEKCPTFYGGSADPSGISDKDNGWWPSGLITGGFDYFSQPSSIQLDFPQRSSYKLLYRYQPINTNNPYYPQGSAFTSDYQYITVAGQYVGYFYWEAMLTTISEEVNVILVYPRGIYMWDYNTSGVATFPWQDINTWRGNWIDGDSGMATSGSFAQIFRYYNDEGGYYGYNYPAQWNTWTTMFVKDPTTLSIAITP